MKLLLLFITQVILFIHWPYVKSFLILTLEPFVLLQAQGYFSSPLWLSQAEAFSFFFFFPHANKGSFSGKHPLPPGQQH